MDLIKTIIDTFMHLDTHLGQMITTYGVATYVILFAIIFVETGLVIMPFLPGDSLLFVAGTFGALGSLNILTLIAVLSTAAIAGDTVNYWIGHFFGQRIEKSSYMVRNQLYLEKTRGFFKKHGGKAVVLARFVPIIRTFAPFVAGAANMHYGRFVFFNIWGGVLWVTVFILMGYLFGNIGFVKENLTILVVGIVVISVLPIAFTAWRSRNLNKRIPSQKANI